MLRQDKSIGAFVPCNVRLHLEQRRGATAPSYIKTPNTGKPLQLNFPESFLQVVADIVSEGLIISYLTSETEKLQQGKHQAGARPPNYFLFRNQLIIVRIKFSKNFAPNIQKSLDSG